MEKNKIQAVVEKRVTEEQKVLKIKPFITVNDKGRARINVAQLSGHLSRKLGPSFYDGEEDLLYRYNQAGLYVPVPDAALRHMTGSELSEHATSARVRDAVQLLKDSLYQDPEKLKVNPMLLNLQNGLLDIAPMLSGGTPVLKPHTFEHYSRSQLPVNYDTGADFTWWIERLHDTFPDDTNKIIVLQQVFGYLIFPALPFPCVLIQVGGGGTGKSKNQEAAIALVGPGNVCHVSLRRMEREFGISELKDKLLNCCAETESAGLDVAIFKQIASGDSIQAPVKFKKDVTFRPFAKHLISMNELPRIKDTTDGFFRRVIILEYNHKFEGGRDDKHFSEKIEKNKDAIFLWALDGLQAVLCDDSIWIPESCREAKERFRARVNPVLQFVSERCVLDDAMHILPQHCFDDYVSWSETGKMKFLGRTRFYEVLRTSFPGIKIKRIDTRDHFAGIGLRNN